MSVFSEEFGSLVFNDKVMKERLPSDVYNSLRKTIKEGKELDLNLANTVADEMKDWAISKGATHFTHWFQPMTGITAEKHDSFLHPRDDGSAIAEFKGKYLIKGEPDASAFPSGGLRATFEARGYTAWDPTSFAFIKDNTLCIPTVFCSYSGETLDKKTPLLRSGELLSEKAAALLAVMGHPVSSVVSMTGAEQEYFLIDKSLWSRREDLRMVGRTLFGAPAPKGQELDDHYFGAIKPKVKAFMYDLNRELWKLGIFAYTEHNEAAPSQHELAPIFTVTNTAADQNQLTMEIMKNVADRHGLVCLLHEKPFKGVNGSGKHNNWSLSTDKGENLFDPGQSPYENTLFLLFLSAVIKAVDEYADLLRISVASRSNDCRLGGNEAPPVIVSIYLGDELTEILDSIESGKKYSPMRRLTMDTGVHSLPDFQKDTTDRNRTSPFAFTGNKFEFRMPGSSQSVSDVNTVLNTATASVLAEFSERLCGKKSIEAAARRLIKETFSKHRRIVFNGNNYSKEWAEEAARRGLFNLPTCADAIPNMISEKNIDLFVRTGILTKSELFSRCEIMTESYVKNVRIEAMTMSDMTKRSILPAVFAYTKELSSGISQKNALGISSAAEKGVLSFLSEKCDSLYGLLNELDSLLSVLDRFSSSKPASEFCRDKLIPKMDALRAVADECEPYLSDSHRPFPGYLELMFGI